MSALAMLANKSRKYFTPFERRWCITASRLPVAVPALLRVVTGSTAKSNTINTGDSDKIGLVMTSRCLFERKWDNRYGTTDMGHPAMLSYCHIACYS